MTVTTGAVPILFPKAGGTGPPRPTAYLEICNAHATNTLGVNWVGGTAAIGAAGTLTLTAGQCKYFYSPVEPGAVSVIGSAASTTIVCAYQ